LAAGAKTSYGDFDPAETPAGRIVADPFTRRRARTLPTTHPADGSPRRAASPRAMAASEVRPEDRRRTPERGREAQGSLGRSTGSALCTKAFAGPTSSTARLRPRGQTPGAAATRPIGPEKRSGGRVGKTAGGCEAPTNKAPSPAGAEQHCEGTPGESHERRRDVRKRPGQAARTARWRARYACRNERRPRMTRSGGVSQLTHECRVETRGAKNRKGEAAS